MLSLRLTQRQWRIYLAVWLAALAAIAGTIGGLTVVRLMHQPSPPSLGGGMVMDPHSVPASDFTLSDQSGRVLSLSDFRGHVVALTFLDTLCTNLCPLQARMLGSTESDLGKQAPFSVVIVSVRPEADTPTTIAAFAQANGLGGPYAWLTGTRPQLSSVWDSYGVGVQVASGDLEHSSVIYLIDRRGFERVAFLDVPETSFFETDIRILETS